jgi:hypothetical protein
MQVCNGSCVNTYLPWLNYSCQFITWRPCEHQRHSMQKSLWSRNTQCGRVRGVHEKLHAFLISALNTMKHPQASAGGTIQRTHLENKCIPTECISTLFNFTVYLWLQLNVSNFDWHFCYSFAYSVKRILNHLPPTEIANERKHLRRYTDRSFEETRRPDVGKNKVCNQTYDNCIIKLFRVPVTTFGMSANFYQTTRHNISEESYSNNFRSALSRCIKVCGQLTALCLDALLLLFCECSLYLHVDMWSAVSIYHGMLITS